MFNPIMVARLLFETHDLNDKPCQQLSLKHRYSSLISKVVASLTFKNSDINNTFLRQSLCTVQCILPMQQNKIFFVFDV